MRDFLRSIYFKDYRERYPEIEMNLFLKRGKHPFVSAVYVNGYTKDIPFRNKKIEVIDMNLETIANQCKFLISKSNSLLNNYYKIFYLFKILISCKFILS